MSHLRADTQATADHARPRRVQRVCMYRDGSKSTQWECSSDLAARAQTPSPRELLEVSIVCGLVLLLLFCVTGQTPVHDGRGHDGHNYAAMAADERYDEPFIPISPYCYRVLTPILVSLLPGPVVSRFLCFNFVTWWAALVAWHLLARRTGVDYTHAMFGTLILATCAWGPMNAFYNPCYIDPLMYLFVIVGLILMLTDSVWLAILLPVSMLQREQTAVVLLASAVVWEVHRHRWSRGRALRYGLVAAACAAVFGVLRYAVTPVDGANMTPWETARLVAAWLIGDPSYILISCLAVAYALGVPLIGLILLPEARRYLTRNRWPEYFLFLCFLSLLGGSDKARLVFLAQPVVLLAFVRGIRGPSDKPVPVIVLAGLFITHLYVQLPPFLMVEGRQLIAPLVDDPDRGTHVASWTLPSYWPVSLTTVALHLVSSLALAGSILWLVNIRQRRHRGRGDSHEQPTTS